MSPPTANRIAILNDAIRRSGPGLTASGNQWVITSGMRGNGEIFVKQTIEAVTSFEKFTPDNDPYGEHDFGSVVVAGQRVFWKIDYYDRSLKFGSPDPADPGVTRRVLTVMLAREY